MPLNWETEFEDRGLLVVASSPRTPSGGASLTDCSQTVRIQPDGIAHVRGKYAGQAHTCVHTWTRRDGLVGFKSRHSVRCWLQGRTTGSTDMAVARLWLSSDRLFAPGVVDHIAPGAVGPDAAPPRPSWRPG
jgi:hypothetical protein